MCPDDRFSKGIADSAFRNIAGSFPSSVIDGVRNDHYDSDLKHIIVLDTGNTGGFMVRVSNSSKDDVSPKRVRANFHCDVKINQMLKFN